MTDFEFDQAFDEAPRKRSKRRGCLLVVGGLALLGFLFLFGIGMALEAGMLPPEEVIDGDQLSSKVVQGLRERGVIEQGEQILFYSTTGTFSYYEDGYLLTDRRFVSFEELEEGLTVESAAFSEIVELEFESGSFLEPSLLFIHTEDDVLFAVLSTTDGGDRRFQRELQGRLTE